MMKISRKFAKAIEIANACADQNVFSEYPDYDCPYCPYLKTCVAFWDDYVVDIDEPGHDLDTVVKVFKLSMERKTHGSLSFWVNKLKEVARNETN